MARSRTPIGTFGSFTFTTLPGGRVRARTRYRDDDGKLRRVEATGKNRAAAERQLKQQLSGRVSRTGTRYGDITADSMFSDLASAWLDDVAVDDGLSPRTRELYETNMRTLVMPAFKHFSLREITVGRVDRFTGLIDRHFNLRTAGRVFRTLNSVLAGDATILTAPESSEIPSLWLRTGDTVQVLLTPHTEQKLRTLGLPRLDGLRSQGEVAIVDLIDGRSQNATYTTVEHRLEFDAPWTICTPTLVEFTTRGRAKPLARRSR